MTVQMTSHDLAAIRTGFDVNPARSLSLRAEAYTDPKWFAYEQSAIFAKHWIWVCHVEKVRANGAYTTAMVAGRPVAIVRDQAGQLRAFYNVCKHRAHELLQGDGETTRIMCPYHAWVYDLTGQLRRAPETENLENFETNDICLDTVQVDNFLECYHCPTAHKDFCTLVDMDTYKVTTHGIYSSHMADAGTSENAAYDVSNATVRTHAVWWLWPTTCLMRYPGRSSMIVLNIIPISENRTLETYDFFLETPEPDEGEVEVIRYLDEVLQVEDIGLVESVQRGMKTPAFQQGRIVHDPEGSGKSEHAVHHFHSLVLDSYEKGTA